MVITQYVSRITQVPHPQLQVRFFLPFSALNVEEHVYRTVPSQFAQPVGHAEGYCFHLWSAWAIGEQQLEVGLTHYGYVAHLHSFRQKQRVRVLLAEWCEPVDLRQQ